MRDLSRAIALIKEFEGLHKKVGNMIHAYLDPVNVATIGWGSIRHPNGKPVKMGDVISLEQAEAYLHIELAEFIRYVNHYIKVPLNDNQFGAILSFTFNRGPGRLRDSKIRKELNAGNYEQAAIELENFKVNKTDNLPGLKRRRKAEAALFRTPVGQPTKEIILAIKPKSKPQAKPEEILNILKANKVTEKVALVCIRGYYLDSMGVKGKNDRGIYDDAMFWVSPEGVVPFNGNADASKYRKGKGSGAEKGMASLNPGVWRYKTGMHNGSVPHPAFRQAAPVKITRDGTNGNYQDTLQSSINIHMGGANGTSSLGCQTVPVDQWNAFKEYGYMLLKRYGLEKNFPYVLIEEENRRAGKLTV